jgi:hypothetical protein
VEGKAKGIARRQWPVLSPAALFSVSLRAASGEEKFVKQPGVPFLVAEGEVHPDLRGVLER